MFRKFNQADFKEGMKLQTKDGRAAEILHIGFMPDMIDEFNIVGIITEKNGRKRFMAWTHNGTAPSIFKPDSNLFMDDQSGKNDFYALMKTKEMVYLGFCTREDAIAKVNAWSFDEQQSFERITTIPND
jgi:hypothetical protein